MLAKFFTSRSQATTCIRMSLLAEKAWRTTWKVIRTTMRDATASERNRPDVSWWLRDSARRKKMNGKAVHSTSVLEKPSWWFSREMNQKKVSTFFYKGEFVSPKHFRKPEASLEAKASLFSRGNPGPLWAPVVEVLPSDPTLYAPCWWGDLKGRGGAPMENQWDEGHFQMLG